jgi:hypothetical protein
VRECYSEVGIECHDPAPLHRWPYLLLPLYRLLQALPRTRAGALRLGVVTHQQMLDALTAAIAIPPREFVSLRCPRSAQV